jgi:hypothetical protein
MLQNRPRASAIRRLQRGHGAILFNKRVADFKPRADLLAGAEEAMLYRRGLGRLRLAIDLSTV